MLPFLYLEQAMKISDLNSKPTAYILIGLPGSGKSTWIRKFMKEHPEDYVVISSDDEIDAYAKSNGLTYSEVFDSYIKTATNIMKSKFNEAIKLRKNIIWDQTNLTIKKRASILHQIPKEYKKIAVLFQIKNDILYKRLEDRAKREGKYIPQHVIDNMKKTFQMVTPQEGFDEIIMV